MKKRVATIRDVARVAGVGVGTASRVLSGRGSVSQDALERVQAAIAELDFRPSHIGRALSANSLGMIGVFVPVFKDAYYGPILQIVDNELRAVDRHMLAVSGYGQADRRRQAIEGIDFLIQRECDGIVILSQDLLDEDLVEIHRRQPNMVLINRHIKALPENSFFVDHRKGGALAARTLLSNGHRKFAVISGPRDAPDNRERIEGFFGELQRNDIDLKQVAFVESDFSREGGWTAAQSLLESKKKFTGLFCANDDMAMAALSCLQEAGVSVPGQVSVIGYDDIQTAAFTFPRLTSIHIPVYELAMSGLQWLLNQCYGSSHSVNRKFPIQVAMRASVGPVGRK